MGYYDSLNEIISYFENDHMQDLIRYENTHPTPNYESFHIVEDLGFREKEIIYPLILILFLTDAHHIIAIGDFSSFKDFYVIGANHSRKNIEDNYKIRQLDIAVNGTTKIDKPICSTCYVLFSQSVEINGTTLPKHSQKRLENNELNVKNLGDIPCKVIQYYI